MSPAKTNWDLFDIVAVVLRLACGGIMVYTGMDKLGDAALFSKYVENYHILPMALVPLAAVVLPWLEFFTGLCLIAGFKWRGGAFIFFILLVIYTLALSWNLLQGVKMDCGCLLHSPEELSIWVVLRDTVFVVMGAFVLTRPKIPLTLD